ncbi:MAG: hypothetical protein K0U84_22530 [Actinomycetia bacterium]|nr:hypothetical protein [Actinomycetes bacterium]
MDFPALSSWLVDFGRRWVGIWGRTSDEETGMACAIQMHSPNEQELA